MSSPKLVLSLFFYSFHFFFCYGSVPFYLLLSHNELILCAIKVSLSSYKLCQPNIGLSNSLERMISAGESFEYNWQNIIANYGRSLFVIFKMCFHSRNVISYSECAFIFGICFHIRMCFHFQNVFLMTTSFHSSTHPKSKQTFQ